MGRLPYLSSAAILGEGQATQPLLSTMCSTT
ncbi:MAG: hypothetical protein QOI76_2286, partial [Frankiales bacterium]|nr:hypothetical protein [Frankiales bacterium]